MTALNLKALSVTRDGRKVLVGVTLQVRKGEMLGLIGPNGAGKTTLLRAALGLLAAEGQSDLAALTPAARARQAAWLPQAREIAWPMPVHDVVALGRLPHGRVGTAADLTAIEAALDRMALNPLRDRPATALSGGEQARVLIARALAQDTALLLADEPIAGLDPAAQLATMGVFHAIARAGRSVVVALHDLGLAARFCDRLALMQDGKLVACGPPDAVLTPDLLRRVFGITGAFVDTASGPVFQPLEVVA